MQEIRRYEVIGTSGLLVLDNACEYSSDMRLHVSGVHGEQTKTFQRRDQVAAGTSRPDLSMEIRIPAHELPPLVDVEQPTK